MTARLANRLAWLACQNGSSSLPRLSEVRASPRNSKLNQLMADLLGSTPHPEALFMQQIVRTLTMAEGSPVHAPHVLICDRDRKWSRDVRRRLREAGIRVMLIPERAPNANAYAERFVRSIKRRMSRSSDSNR